MDNKQFFVLYFNEADTLVIQTAPLHDTNDTVIPGANGVISTTHTRRWNSPNGQPEVVGFTVQNASFDVSLLNLLYVVGPGLNISLTELAGALTHVEGQIKNKVANDSAQALL